MSRLGRSEAAMFWNLCIWMAYMATLTSQRTSRSFCFNAAGDHMIVAVAMAIHTLKPRFQVHIFIPCPLMLFCNATVLIGMAEVTSLVGGAVYNIKENLIIVIKQAFFVFQRNTFIKFKIKEIVQRRGHS